MNLSIIINHYRTPEILKLNLEYLKGHLDQQENEIIVTDSETDEETQEMIENFFPLVKFIPAAKNIGFGRSVNPALKEAAGKYILILNADILATAPGCLEKMTAYFQKHPETGLLGPALLNINNSHQDSCFRFYTPLIILLRRSFLGKTRWGRKKLDDFALKSEVAQNQTNPLPVDWLMGSALLTTRQALEKVGFFDERFFMYFEDVDWCRRFWEAGYQVVYFPEVKMHHYHIQSSKKGQGIFDFFLSKYARIHLLSALKYFLKHGLTTPRYGT